MSFCQFRWSRVAVCLTVLASAHSLPAVASVAAGLDECAAVAEEDARLRCFEALARSVRATRSADVVAITPAGDAGTSGKPDGRQVTPLSERWELEPASKKGVWSFRAHKPNYFLLGRYTDSVNMKPYDVYFNAVGDPGLGIDETESKFQMSFKLKAMEDLFGTGSDLWLGYTQQNHWQVYNGDISAPFRETNYEPEVFVTIPARYDFLGLTGRFVNLGFVHQSNGQSYVLSRSWNRVYAQFGFEYGDKFNLLIKPWHRIEEDAKDDDNPNITDYMGDFEVVASYKLGRHTLSALARSGFDFERGFLQLDWSFPLYQNLKGYVQATTGYGESLIDYDHDQNTIGVGVLLTDWM